MEKEDLDKEMKLPMETQVLHHDQNIQQQDTKKEEKDTIFPEQSSIFSPLPQHLLLTTPFDPSLHNFDPFHPQPGLLSLIAPEIPQIISPFNTNPHHKSRRSSILCQEEDFFIEKSPSLSSRSFFVQDDIPGQDQPHSNREYNCPYPNCNANISKRNLSAHILEVHNGGVSLSVEDVTNAGWYKCGHCGYIFPTLATLQRPNNLNIIKIEMYLKSSRD